MSAQWTLFGGQTLGGLLSVHLQSAPAPQDANRAPLRRFRFGSINLARRAALATVLGAVRSGEQSERRAR